MSQGIALVVALLLSRVLLGECALRMCTRCECTYKDGLVRIDCNNQQYSETHLRQIQANQNTSFIGLNFSRNNFSKVPHGFNTKGVQYLDLSENNIKSPQGLNEYQDLLELNLAHNDIQDLSEEVLSLPMLKSLNVSHCSLKDLSGFTNSSLAELITLDLSRNLIETFDNEFVANLTKLNYLDLSNNLLKQLDVLIFENLQILDIENNMIGPDFKFPSTLIELNAQNNAIVDLYMNEVDNQTTSSMEFLYLNQNKLAKLPNVSFPSLRILDLNQNEFKQIPEVLNVYQCPTLEILVLSNNPFERFQFAEKLQLRSLKVSGIKSLRKLTKDTFKMLGNHLNQCVNISLRNNPELHTVEDTTFDHLDVCFLDLANNSLSHLPQIRTKSGNWTNIEYGIDFQNNPIYCDCNAQWLLDEFVQFYYKKDNLQSLLSDLRCADPYYIRSYRLVHWYQWENSIFCQDETTVLARLSSNITDKPFSEIVLHSSGTMLLVLTICTAFLATLFVIGLISAKRVATRKSRRNRRF